MIFSVDRIENEYIVLVSDDGEIRLEQRLLFFEDVREGDVFLLDEEKFVPCTSIEEARRKQVRAWMNKHRMKG